MNNENDYCKNCETPLMYPQKPCPKCGIINQQMQTIIEVDHILKKPFIIALMPIGMGWIINLIFSLFGISPPGMGVILGVATGSIYTQKFKEVIPKNIRIKAAIYYGILAYFISMIVIFITMQNKIPYNHINFLILGLGITALESFAFYWVLGKGGRIELKRLEKIMQTESKQAKTNKKNTVILSTIIFIAVGLVLFAASSLDKHLKQVNYSEKENAYAKNKEVEKTTGINFNPYMEKLQKKIKKNWHPPMGTENEQIIVLFKLTKNGALIESNIKKASSNPKLNEAALIAIEKSAPFDPLPEEYNEEDVSIQFTFDYNVFKTNNHK